MDCCILGYSGHALVVLEAAKENGWKLVCYCSPEKSSNNPFDLTYLGDERKPESPIWQSKKAILLGIGENHLRHKLAVAFHAKEYELPNVIHPNASISSYLKLGYGNFIARNASINPFCEIEDACIINTSASVDHECILRNGCHIAPGAVLAGNVQIGEMAFIGANSVIKQGVKIGKNAIIGAGAVVLKDVEANSKVVGNPAKPISSS